MIRVLLAAAVAGLFIAGSAQGATRAATPAPKADCSKFKKLNDGHWSSTIESKVGNPTNFVTLQPGLPIDPNLVVVGINVSDTIERLCGDR